MLPLGKLRVTDPERGPQDSKFTPDEQRTVMTLWSIFRSPLIMGGDLPTSNSATFTLLTNPEVININQHSTDNHQTFDRDGIRAWVARAADSDTHYVAVFNLADEARQLELKWPELGISYPIATVRELWERRELGSRRTLNISLRPHASALYEVSAGK